MRVSPSAGSYLKKTPKKSSATLDLVAPNRFSQEFYHEAFFWKRPFWPLASFLGSNPCSAWQSNPSPTVFLFILAPLSQDRLGDPFFLTIQDD